MLEQQSCGSCLLLLSQAALEMLHFSNSWIFSCTHGNFNSLPLAVVTKLQGSWGELISVIGAVEAGGKSHPKTRI